MADLTLSLKIPGELYANRIRSGDLARCKKYLAQHFTLDTDQQSLLAKTPPAQLYAVGATLGIPPSKMAQAIAVFLQLPYLAQSTPGDFRPGVLSGSFCQARLVAPIRQASAPFAFALSNPFDLELIETLRHSADPHQPSNCS